MKQHDLLVLLCEAHPLVFTITVSFKEKTVLINASKPRWEKTIPYDRYRDTDLEKLSKEILDDYAKATAAKEVLANG